MEIYLSTESATQQLAKKVAKFVIKGDVIRLEGELGMGKSTIARAFIKAMGSKEKHIPSPTYTIAQIYDDTRISIAHLDCYRLENIEDLNMLGLENIFENGIIIAEWPLENLCSSAPKAGTLNIKLCEFKAGRKAIISAEGTWKNRLKKLNT